MSLVHGGNVYEVASRLGCSPEDILDYSASINPLGPPPGLLEEISRYFNRLEHYPDIGNRVLLRALSSFHGISPDHIVVGNGSTELIYWLPRVLDVHKVLVVLPTFSEYQKAFEIQGIELHKLICRVDTDLQPELNELDSVFERVRPDAILVTHPGSPSGTLLPRPVRSWLVEKSAQQGVFCILDEVFVDFCEGESLKKFVSESSRLLIIRSMTKFYGIPGLRLGYLMTSELLARRLRAWLPPWSVNTLAQIAGSYCLEQEAYRHKTLALVNSERDAMMKALRQLAGCRVFPGTANYLLLQLAENYPPARVLQQDLLSSERILVRDCSSFEGLNDHCVRLAVRLPGQNRQLLTAVSHWMQQHRY